MTVAAHPISRSASAPGALLHRFTVTEYGRLRDLNILGSRDPVELLEGGICIKMDYGPPYEVPAGIPPEILSAQSRLPGVPLRRFSVAEYDRMVEGGVFRPDLRHELVEGWVVDKMVHNPRHDSCVQRLAKALSRLLGDEWELRLQSAVSLDDGRPEPDLVVVPGPVGRFDDNHPLPVEVALLIEVADSTLAYDRTLKLRSYARNYIRRYWLVDLAGRQVEAYEEPSGPTDAPAYARRQVFGQGAAVPVCLQNRTVGVIHVDDILPRL